MENETANRYETIDLGSGIRLLVDTEAKKDLELEPIVYATIRRCKLVAMGRDKARTRIKECIGTLARIDAEHDGNRTELVFLSESIGWTSNNRTHTTEDYRRALTVLVDVLDDDDLADALEAAEEYVAQAQGVQ